jgi:hypothetical protein
MSGTESDELSFYKKLVKERVGCDIPNFKLQELNCMAIQLKLELYMSE